MMRVEFTAFADDSIFSGNLDLAKDRLSDAIAEDNDIEIRDVIVVALDDGREVTVSAVTISRSDFAALTGDGPRGNPQRRIPTRPHPIRTRIGPYDVVGYLHSPPSTHTLSGLVRRRVVPLTSATIRYRLGARVVQRAYDSIMLNGDRVVWVQPATNEDLALGATIDIPTRFSRPKDMTGHVGG